MPEYDIAVTAVRPTNFVTGTWTAISYFDAQVGDFRIRNGILKRSAGGEKYLVSLAGRPDRSLTLPAICETRDRLLAAVVGAYEAARK